jgi:hypothetical protein
MSSKPPNQWPSHTASHLRKPESSILALQSQFVFDLQPISVRQNWVVWIVNAIQKINQEYLKVLAKQKCCFKGDVPLQDALCVRLRCERGPPASAWQNLYITWNSLQHIYTLIASIPLSWPNKAGPMLFRLLTLMTIKESETPISEVL